MLEWLQQWYLSQCNGDCEHGTGIHIDTIDNPGRRVSINLRGTTAEGATLEPHEEDLGDDDWFVYKVDNGVFVGHGDPTKLILILDAFRRVVDHV
jgi:hypothetical protein